MCVLFMFISPSGRTFSRLGQDSQLAIEAVGIPTVTRVKMLLESCWTALVHFFSFQSLFATQQSPLPPNGGLGYPLPPSEELNYPSPTTSAAQQPTPTKILKFKPIDASIECEYEGLSDTYVALPRGDQRTWLKPKPNVNGTTYDIHTNYETTWPKGKVRDVGDALSPVFRKHLNDTTYSTALQLPSRVS